MRCLQQAKPSKAAEKQGSRVMTSQGSSLIWPCERCAAPGSLTWQKPGSNSCVGAGQEGCACRAEARHGWSKSWQWPRHCWPWRTSPCAARPLEPAGVTHPARHPPGRRSLRAQPPAAPSTWRHPPGSAGWASWWLPCQGWAPPVMGEATRKRCSAGMGGSSRRRHCRRRPPHPPLHVQGRQAGTSAAPGSPAPTCHSSCPVSSSTP